MPDSGASGYLELTDDELAALRRIVDDWIGEGFTTPPYESALASVIAKVRSAPGTYGT